MKLYLVPIEYMYGGGYSIIIKANNEEEAREKASKLYTKDTWKEAKDINDFAALGNIDDFEYALIGYWE